MTQRGRHAPSLIGQTFGRWTVTARAENRGRAAFWLCLCVCGKTKEIRTGNLTGGHSQSCGCLLRDMRSAQCVPYLSMHNQLVKKAKSRNILITLTHEEYCELAQQPNCTYCGARLRWRKSVADGPASNLDRKDSSLGYTKENCTPCCPRCNRLKMTMPYEEWLVAIRAINRYRKNGFQIADEDLKIPRTKEEVTARLYELFGEQAYVRRSQECEMTNEYTEVHISGEVDMLELATGLHEFLYLPESF